MSEKYSFRSSMNGFNRSEVITYIEKLMADNMELSVKLATLENEIAALKSENSELKTAMSNELEKKENTDKCEDCSVSKVYEARLGAAMLDAKRFSEVLVKEANDKVSGIFTAANDDAGVAYEGTRKLIVDIKSANNQMNESFAAILDNLSRISKSIDSFCVETNKKAQSYNYDTNFADSAIPQNTENVSEVVHKPFVAESANQGINFDDADEYEIKVCV